MTRAFRRCRLMRFSPERVCANRCWPFAGNVYAYWTMQPSKYLRSSSPDKSAL